MPNIALTSFMKILSCSALQKSREYRKYLSPGGYDFYWHLKDAAADLTILGKSFDECLEQIIQIKREVERTHNLHGLNSLRKWLADKKHCSFFSPPRGVCSSPKGHLTVKLEPEFGFEELGKTHLVQLWNCKGTELKPNVAAVGIYLLRQHLISDGFSETNCIILDLRKGKAFSGLAIPPNIPAVIASEFAWVDSFFEHASKAA